MTPKRRCSERCPRRSYRRLTDRGIEESSTSRRKVKVRLRCRRFFEELRELDVMELESSPSKSVKFRLQLRSKRWFRQEKGTCEAHGNREL